MTGTLPPAGGAPRALTDSIRTALAGRSREFWFALLLLAVGSALRLAAQHGVREMDWRLTPVGLWAWLWPLVVAWTGDGGRALAIPDHWRRSGNPRAWGWRLVQWWPEHLSVLGALLAVATLATQPLSPLMIVDPLGRWGSVALPPVPLMQALLMHALARAVAFLLCAHPDSPRRWFAVFATGEIALWFVEANSLRQGWAEPGRRIAMLVDVTPLPAWLGGGMIAETPFASYAASGLRFLQVAVIVWIGMALDHARQLGRSSAGLPGILEDIATGITRSTSRPPEPVLLQLGEIRGWMRGAHWALALACAAIFFTLVLRPSLPNGEAWLVAMLAILVLIGAMHPLLTMLTPWRWHAHGTLQEIALMPRRPGEVLAYGLGATHRTTARILVFLCAAVAVALLLSKDRRDGMEALFAIVGLLVGFAIAVGFLGLEFFTCTLRGRTLIGAVTRLLTKVVLIELGILLIWCAFLLVHMLRTLPSRVRDDTLFFAHGIWIAWLLGAAHRALIALRTETETERC